MRQPRSITDLFGKGKVRGAKPARKTSRRPRQSSGVLRPVDLSISDLFLFAIFCLAPLAMGGRTELGRGIYVLLVAAFALSWLTERIRLGGAERFATGAEWLLVLGLALVTLQILPLPAEWLSKASPKIAELLPSWQNGAVAASSYGEWRRISLTPHATTFAIFVYTAHVVLFLVLVHKLATPVDVERLIKTIALSAVFVALVAMTQYLSGTPRYVWIFQHASRNANEIVCGPFANGNHFVHFLALGLGAVLWWLQDALKPVQRGPTGNRANSGSLIANHEALLLIIALCLLLFTGMLARSRGGILMMAIALTISISAYVWLQAIPRRALLALAGAGVLVGIGLAVHGADVVQEEVGSLTSGSMEELDQNQGRRKLWAANLAVSKAFPILGTGVGSHAEVYKLEFPYASRVEYTHAESGYLNLLTETGWAGMALLAVGSLMVVRWCVRAFTSGSGANRILVVAAASGIGVSLVHSVFDFPWYLTSCMSVAIAFCAAACRLDGFQRGRSVAEPMPPFTLKFMVLTGCFVVVVAIGVMLGPAVASVHFTDYLAQSLRSRQSYRIEHAVAMASPEDFAEEQKASHQRNQQMLEQLQKTLAWDPHHPRANLRLSTLLLKSFDYLQADSANAMALSQIRDAAVASKFTDFEAQRRWLEAAVGENLRLLFGAREHAHRALARCPMLARAYLNCADLGFLTLADEEDQLGHLTQAQTVRPHDPAVLFALGRESAIRGNAEQAMALWKQAFHLEDEYRDAIIRAMAPQLPARLFVEYFAPEPRDLSRIYRFYRDHNLQQHMRDVAPQLLQNLEEEAQRLNGERAARKLLEAVAVCQQLNDIDGAVARARLACDRAPNFYNVHKVLGQQLIVAQEFEESIPELNWCIRRRSCDEQAKELLQIAQQALRQQRGLPIRASYNNGEMSRQ